jgi:2-phospho-L-lactate guanylyltransferase
MRTIAILPVKGFSNAKQRLRGGLSPELRESLAEAMFSDVLGALALASLDAVLVVTAGQRARRIAEAHGATVLEDDEAGHNEAAAIGLVAALERRADRALLVPGDCPALDPADLDALLARQVVAPSALVVPDRHGTGTNALLLTPPDALVPSFGPGSCQRHLSLASERGTHAEVVRIPSLALDVDTPEDLEALLSSTDRARATHELLSRC